MAINLEKLETQLDEALAKETKESLEKLFDDSKETNEDADWKIIPEYKLKSYIDMRPRSNIFCDDCQHFNAQIEGIPYAYDEENNDIIFAHQCEKCGAIIYTRE